MAANTKGLLNEILSDDIEPVYVRITNKAVEWMAAGFVDEANELLQQLWEFKIPHSENLWLPDEGLQVIWTVSNKTPRDIPFDFKDISEIEEENWFRVFDIGYDEIKAPLKLLDELKAFLQTKDAVGYSYFEATSRGSLLAAKANLATEANHFIKLWGEGYLKYRGNYMLSYLMRDRDSARLLLSGILAPVFKLTKEICHQETKDIIDTLSNRMTNGRTLVYGDLSWEQLLNRISELAIEQDTAYFSEEILESKTLTKPKATQAEIALAEKRLNIIFPEDYKAFLLTSNGFECFDTATGVTVSAIDKVDLLINVDEQLINIWTDGVDDTRETFAKKMRDSIIIGGREEEQQLLLIPLEDNKWECWLFTSWVPGEVIYESFRFYMEHELQKLENGFYTD